MLDFRYHALSLVAVFLALGIGILLGTTIGDSLVSEANRDIADSLRGDVVDARAEARRARSALADREQLIQAAFARIAGGKLRGRSIAVVSSGSLPQRVETDVRDAIQDAGGEVARVAEIGERPSLRDLGEVAGRRFEDLRDDDPRLGPLGRRIGRALAGGTQLASRLAERFPDRFRGDFPRVDGIVFYRDPGVDRSKGVEEFERGLIAGLRDGRDPVVGVEALDTDPTQVPFYEDRLPASVDAVDSPGGRIALVLALRGARGSFGYKSSADEPLPQPRGR
ncbi:MAG TPA: copper transporter [Thermoleophilaceae bacterium]